jgi:hypothetical protein
MLLLFTLPSLKPIAYVPCATMQDNDTNCRTKALLFKNGRVNPAAIDALCQLGNDDRHSQSGRGRRYEACDRRQQRAIANHVQGPVAAELASLFPETVVKANVSSSYDSQYHHLPSPHDVPLIFHTGTSTTIMPHTCFHRTVWHATTAVSIANGESTRVLFVAKDETSVDIMCRKLCSNFLRKSR